MLEISDVARRWLGLDHDKADHLFYGSWSDKGRRLITKQETIAHLKRMLRKDRKKEARA